MKKIKALFLLIIICFTCVGCSKKEVSNIINEEHYSEIDDKQESTKLYSGPNGTADTIEGKTVIVSIYANDEVVTWNSELESDILKIDNTLNNLKIATDYLVNQVAKYNKTAEFIYDWHKYSDLKYETTFTDNIVDKYDSEYDTQKEWIVDNIDIVKIKKKYEADNIVFVYFFNTNDTNTAITSTYNREIDIVNVFPENNKYIAPPATYAHELLHAFGAPDLYFENAVINQEYVDYYMETNPSDIMASVYYGDEITNTFSDLDAYYVGLIDSHPDIEKWNLGISEHAFN